MYLMRRYTVAVLRERLAEALNEVDRGVPVLIERRGVRYRLTRETKKAPGPRRKPVITQVDSDVAAGQWTWDWTPAGIQFAGDRRS
jgi:hypothetical protein